MKNHHIWMVIACVLPLLLIFFLPLFGAGRGQLLFVFLILCFGMHLLMITRHKGNGGNKSGGKGGPHGNH